jgi:hypothetical protein
MVTVLSDPACWVATERRGFALALANARIAAASASVTGRKRRLVGQQGTRTAIYLRVSTAEQKPDLQHDGLSAYAAYAGLNVVQDYFDVGVSGRREGRPN